MGDDCCNPDSMGRVKTLMETELPQGTFVYSVQVGTNTDSDHKAGFFGRIEDQVDQVCKELGLIPELAQGFNAVGFSQVSGGLNLCYTLNLTSFLGWIIFKVHYTMVNLPMIKLNFFLRAYVERCNLPKVHRLITFGSPHGGVSDIPNCTNPKDFTCKLMRSMVHSGVYTDYIQNRIIQAQYYRDPRNEKGKKEKYTVIFVCLC